MPSLADKLGGRGGGGGGKGGIKVCPVFQWEEGAWAVLLPHSSPIIIRGFLWSMTVTLLTTAYVLHGVNICLILYT